MGHMSLRRAVTVASCCLAAAGCDRSQPDAGTGGSSDVKSAAVPSVSPSRARTLGLTRRLPPAYRKVCAEHSAYAPAGAQACPPLIPAGSLEVVVAAPFSKREAHRGGYSADFFSGSLSELHGERIETNGGHWHYDVSWTPAVRRLLVRHGVKRPVNASKASACRDVRLGSERAEACRVVPYEEGGGLNGGHIAYVWTHGRATYVVSLHGYRNEPRASAMTLVLMAQVLREGS